MNTYKIRCDKKSSIRTCVVLLNQWTLHVLSK
jgi:hypothetical protein